MKKLTPAAALFLMILGYGCGPDDSPPPIVPGANNGANNGQNNGTTPNNGPSNGTNNETNNGIVDVACAMQEEFTDQSVEVERPFQESTNLDIVSCAADVGEIATNGSYIAKLTYSEATRLTIGVLGIATDGTPPRPAVEVRKGSCDGGEVVLCASAPSHELDLEANTPYYVVVNGLLDSGGVALTLDAQSESSCTPGTITCPADTALLCTSTGDTRELPCAGGCAEDNCVGDVCTMPIPVSPVANGDPVKVEGNRITFSNQWTADGLAGCETAEGEGSAPTPGPEFFMLVEGVTAGQTVVLDAENANGRYSFFVLEDCSAVSCLGAYEFDANNLNRGEFVAAATGSVLVAVEAVGPDLDRLFNIEVAIRD